MKINVADWLVHGGHQYEFFKTGPNFICTNPNGSQPSYENLGRPKNIGVTYVDSKGLLKSRFEVVMVRAGVSYKPYLRRIKMGRTPGIAVMQTYLPYRVPSWVRSIVWNSKVVMHKHKGEFPGKKHFYIPHGFDPREFRSLGIRREPHILSAASLFEQRKKVMGYNEWRWVADKYSSCKLLGHGNELIPESIGSFALKDLIVQYNRCSVFLNTTTRSAMPRVRAEAMMCGTPIVTTKNFGIEDYLTHGKDCYFADTKEDMLKYCVDIIDSKSLREELGGRAREAAIRSFNIDEYKNRWKHVFYETLR
tara:strand:+ start:1005 stop:1925 length:921 start_codon:yes stop_codon:yes gene_type:complete